MVQINKEAMAKNLKLQAASRNLIITDEQIANSIAEAEEMMIVAFPLMAHVPVEQRVISAFMTGMIFGLDKCDPKKEDLIVVLK